MKRLLLVIAIGAAVAIALAAVPFGAAGGKRFLIGRQLNFTGPTTAAGTFSIAGAYSDSGSVTATFTATPGKDNTTIFSGDETQTGDHGTISVHFDVVSYPASDPREFNNLAAAGAAIPSATIEDLRLQLEKMKAVNKVQVAD